MNVLIYDNEKEIGEAIGKIFVEEVNSQPGCVLGLATGASPIPTYQYMADVYRKGDVSFRQVTTFNLDEYCDLPQANPNSFFSFMAENLFSQTDVDMNRVNFLNGNAPDPDAECVRYEQAIRQAGGIDLQLLGIGTNGHIGFNEPAEVFSTATYRVQLTQSTIDSNQKYFGDVPMPRYALTMGTRSIMHAKRVILVATGDSKAAAAQAMINGPVSAACPASILQEHGDATIFLDKAAARLL